MRKWYPQATLELRRPLGTMLEMRRLRSVRERDSTSKKLSSFIVSSQSSAVGKRGLTVNLYESKRGTVSAGSVLVSEVVCVLRLLILPHLLITRITNTVLVVVDLSRNCICASQFDLESVSMIWTLFY